MRVAMFLTALLIATPAFAKPAKRRTVVEITRKTPVFAEPRRGPALRRGKLSSGIRLVVRERAKGPGCRKSWLRIHDNAWVCGQFARATKDAPTADALPAVDDGQIVPHTYVLTHDARAYRSLADAAAGRNERRLRGLGGYRVKGQDWVDGHKFFQLAPGWVPASDAELADPSSMRGVDLRGAAHARRVAFVTAARAPVVDARNRPLRGKRLERHSAIEVNGAPRSVGKHTLYPIGPGRFARDRDLGRVEVTAPPADVGRDAERWIDVSIPEQVLVAYEGKRPVFATPVSTSRAMTPEGVFRINLKRVVSFMRSKPDQSDAYDLDTPWVMTLKDRIAMHAVYWHDDFGIARSHGCVNLAPRAARWIWNWSEPRMPAGWLRVETGADDEGTVVRIRR